MNNEEEASEKYIGSVRFYKHLILTIVALAVLIPVCISCYLGVCNSELRTKYQQAQNKLTEKEAEVDSLTQQLEEANAKKETTELELLRNKHSKDSWKLVLVNEHNPIQKGFTIDLKQIEGGQKVDARIVDDLNAMLEAMKKDGLNPYVCSGYRTLEKQESLFKKSVKNKEKQGRDYTEAFYLAKKQLALPGYSEHHTGLAIDITGKDYQSLDAGQAKTAEAIWLAEHCAEYGFILRYPMNKEPITGIEYESWHFRYVGKEAASYIMKAGITLEEFLEKL